MQNSDASIGIKARIFDYSSLEAFLTAYIESQRQSRRTWTIQAWAKRLQLPNAASITRVLSGERTITSRMSNALQDHFAFSQLEGEYFLFLVLKNKSSGDPILQEAVQRGCWPVASHQEFWEGQKSLLEIRDGNVIGLTGEANLETVNQILREDGLECIPVNNCARVELCVADYGGSTVGPYTEFYISVLCQPKGATLVDVGISFRNIICTSAAIVNLGRMVWGNDYQVGQVSLQECTAQVAVAGQVLLEMGADQQPEAAAISEAMEFWGFAAVHGSRRRYRMQLQSLKRESAFHAKSSIFKVNAESDCGRFLQKISFVPKQWSFRTALQCHIAPTCPQ